MAGCDGTTIGLGGGGAKTSGEPAPTDAEDRLTSNALEDERDCNRLELEVVGLLSAGECGVLQVAGAEVYAGSTPGSCAT